MYLFIMILLSILSLVFYSKGVDKKLLILLIILVSLFVGLRGENVDNDYQNYLASIRLGEGVKESSFYWISNLFIKTFNNPVSIFLFYAFLSITLKFIAFDKLSNFLWLTLLIYFPTFFILQEMNAIRAGVASGLFLISLPYWASEKPFKALPLLLLAFIFHYSFIILIPFLLFVRNKKSNSLIYLLIIPFAYVFYSYFDRLVGPILKILDNTYIYEKVNDYSSTAPEQVGKIFSIIFIVKILILVYLYTFKNIISSKNKYFYLLFKLNCIGIFLVVFFNAASPLAAIRFYEIFVIVELFLIPTILYTFSPRIIPIIAIIIYSSSYYYLNIIFSHFLKPYNFIFQK